MEKKHVNGCLHGYTKVRGSFNPVGKKEHRHERYLVAKCPYGLNDTDKRLRNPEDRERAASPSLMKTPCVCVKRQNLDLA